MSEILCPPSRPRDPLSWCYTSTSISSPDRNVTGIRGSSGPQLADCAFRSEPAGGGQNSPICVLDCSKPICWGGWIQTSNDQEQILLLTHYQGKIVVLHWLVENVPTICVYIYIYACICMLIFCKSNLWNSFKNCSAIWIGFKFIQASLSGFYYSVPNNR